MRYLAAYVAALVVFIGLDFTFLTIIARDLYVHEIGGLLSSRPQMVPAVLFYLVYLAGVVAFVVAPALARGRWIRAAGFGALFGLVAYAAYDLTNLATLKGFSSTIAVVDMAWGATVTSIAASAGYAAARIAGGRRQA
jgi:uncharacterized membrane protein